MSTHFLLSALTQGTPTPAVSLRTARTDQQLHSTQRQWRTLKEILSRGSYLVSQVPLGNLNSLDFELFCFQVVLIEIQSHHFPSSTPPSHSPPNPPRPFNSEADIIFTLFHLTSMYWKFTVFQLRTENIGGKWDSSCLYAKSHSGKDSRLLPGHSASAPGFLLDRVTWKCFSMVTSSQAWAQLQSLRKLYSSYTQGDNWS